MYILISVCKQAFHSEIHSWKGWFVYSRPASRELLDQAAVVEGEFCLCHSHVYKTQREGHYHKLCVRKKKSSLNSKDIKLSFENKKVIVRLACYLCIFWIVVKKLFTGAQLPTHHHHGQWWAGCWHQEWGISHQCQWVRQEFRCPERSKSRLLLYLD